MGILNLAERIERYDPTLSSDNRADELELHRDIVLATGLGGMNPDFENTFVRSIDAALTLVPEGWEWTVSAYDDGSISTCAPSGTVSLVETSEGATPALALCAAALKALAHQGDNRNG